MGEPQPSFTVLCVICGPLEVFGNAIPPQSVLAGHMRIVHPRYPYAIEVEYGEPAASNDLFRWPGERRKRLVWVNAPQPSDPNPFPKLRLWWSLFSRKGAQR